MGCDDLFYYAWVTWSLQVKQFLPCHEVVWAALLHFVQLSMIVRLRLIDIAQLDTGQEHLIMMGIEPGDARQSHEAIIHKKDLAPYLISLNCIVFLELKVVL